MYTSPSTVASVLALICAASAQGISNSSIPSSCQAICTPVVQLTGICNVDMSMMMDIMASNGEMETSGGDDNNNMNGMEMGGDKMEDGMNMNKKRQMEMEMEMSDNDKKDGMDMNMSDMNMDDAEASKAEMDCVCQNKSFDVAKVMGFCGSCLGMQMDEGSKSAMMAVNMVMDTCSFPAQTYTPEATSILSGLQVEATMPVMTIVAGDTSPSSMASDAANMNGVGQMAGSGRVEVDTGVWGVGMLVANLGLGLGMVFGLL